MAVWKEAVYFLDNVMLLTYAMQLHRIPTGLYRQDTVLKVFQEIYWYIPYRNSASSKRNFLRSEVLLLQTHSGIPVCDDKHRWSLTFRTPASFRLINSPKSSFIFKHQSDSFGLILGLGIQHTGFNFLRLHKPLHLLLSDALSGAFFCSSHVFSIHCRHTRAQYPCHRLHPKLF